METKSLVQYVTSRKHGRTAVVVATCEGKLIKIGWSAVNVKAGDKFDKERAIRIALSRTNAVAQMNIPRRVSKLIGEMIPRAQKYFKGAVFI